jgi:hypothetical protein
MSEVSYGVSDPIVAIELDDVVSALFDERETPVAVILGWVSGNNLIAVGLQSQELL